MSMRIVDCMRLIGPLSTWKEGDDPVISGSFMLLTTSLNVIFLECMSPSCNYRPWQKCFHGIGVAIETSRKSSLLLNF